MPGPAKDYIYSVPGDLQEFLMDEVDPDFPFSVMDAHHRIHPVVLTRDHIAKIQAILGEGVRTDRVIANLLAYGFFVNDSIVREYLKGDTQFKSAEYLDHFLSNPGLRDQIYTKDSSNVPLTTIFNIPVAGGRRRRASRKYKKSRRHRKSRSQKRR
jgi:hypothetical protein